MRHNHLNSCGLALAGRFTTIDRNESPCSCMKELFFYAYSLQPSYTCISVCLLLHYIMDREPHRSSFAAQGWLTSMPLLLNCRHGYMSRINVSPVKKNYFYSGYEPTSLIIGTKLY